MKTINEIKQDIVDVLLKAPEGKELADEIREAYSADNLLETLKENMDELRRHGVVNGKMLADSFPAQRLEKHRIFTGNATDPTVVLSEGMGWFFGSRKGLVDGSGVRAVCMEQSEVTIRAGVAVLHDSATGIAEGGGLIHGHDNSHSIAKWGDRPAPTRQELESEDFRRPDIHLDGKASAYVDGYAYVYGNDESFCELVGHAEGNFSGKAVFHAKGNAEVMASSRSRGVVEGSVRLGTMEQAEVRRVIGNYEGTYIQDLVDGPDGNLILADMNNRKASYIPADEVEQWLKQGTPAFENRTLRPLDAAKQELDGWLLQSGLTFWSQALKEVKQPEALLDFCCHYMECIHSGNRMTGKFLESVFTREQLEAKQVYIRTAQEPEVTLLHEKGYFLGEARCRINDKWTAGYFLEQSGASVGKGFAVLMGTSTAEAYGLPEYAHRQSYEDLLNVRAFDRSFVKAHGAMVELNDHAEGMALGTTMMKLNFHSRGYATDDAIVWSRDEAQCVMDGNSVGYFRDDSRFLATVQAQVNAYDQASGNIAGHAECYLHGNARLKDEPLKRPTDRFVPFEEHTASRQERVKESGYKR